MCTDMFYIFLPFFRSLLYVLHWTNVFSYFCMCLDEITLRLVRFILPLYIYIFTSCHYLFLSRIYYHQHQKKNNPYNCTLFTNKNLDAKQQRKSYFFSKRFLMSRSQRSISVMPQLLNDYNRKANLFSRVN